MFKARINRFPYWREVGCGMLLAVVGGVVAAMTTVTTRNAEASKTWPTVKAKITESRLSGNPISNNKHRANIGFAYDVDGTTYFGNRYRFGEMSTTRNNARGIVKTYSRGKIVDLRYNPADPEMAVLRTGVGFEIIVLKYVSWFMLIVGVVVLLMLPFEKRLSRWYYRRF